MEKGLGSMKKIFLLTLLLMGALCTVYFASAEAAPQRIGIVLIGGSDFKSQGFYRYAQEHLKDKNNAYTVEASDAVQTKYLNYWMDKGELEEQKAKKQDLLDFVKYAGYDKVLYLMAADPVTESHRTGLWGLNTFTRTSVQIRGFLCNRETILATHISNKDGDSETSELRARRDAFKKALHDMGDYFPPYMAK